MVAEAEAGEETAATPITSTFREAIYETPKKDIFSRSETMMILSRKRHKGSVGRMSAL